MPNIQIFCMNFIFRKCTCSFGVQVSVMKYMIYFDVADLTMMIWISNILWLLNIYSSAELQAII